MYVVVDKMEKNNRLLDKEVSTFETYETARAFFEKTVKFTLDDVGFPSDECDFKEKYEETCGKVFAFIDGDSAHFDNEDGWQNNIQIVNDPPLNA